MQNSEAVIEKIIRLELDILLVVDFMLKLFFCVFGMALLIFCSKDDKFIKLKLRKTL